MGKSIRGADKIIESISSQLASGSLKNGDRLPAEAKLCEQFKVSRTVVREAIQQLKAIGVLKTITGSGSYITDGNLDGFKTSLEFYSIMTGDTESWVEMLEMRILLESACAMALAGDKFTQKGFNKIKSALQQMADNKDDKKLFSELDVKFHQTLILESGNKLSYAILTALANLHLKFANETYLVENSQQLIEKNYNEHANIVNAIEKRDPNLAKEAMNTHLNETMKNLKIFIQKRD